MRILICIFLFLLCYFTNIHIYFFDKLNNANYVSVTQGVYTAKWGSPSSQMPNKKMINNNNNLIFYMLDSTFNPFKLQKPYSIIVGYNKDKLTSVKYLYIDNKKTWNLLIKELSNVLKESPTKNEKDNSINWETKNLKTKLQSIKVNDIEYIEISIDYKGGD